MSKSAPQTSAAARGSEHQQHRAASSGVSPVSLRDQRAAAIERDDAHPGAGSDARVGQPRPLSDGGTATENSSTPSPSTTSS